MNKKNILQAISFVYEAKEEKSLKIYNNLSKLQRENILAIYNVRKAKDEKKRVISVTPKYNSFQESFHEKSFSNLYWRNLGANHIVYEKGDAYFTTDNCLIFWTGGEAISARFSLSQRAAKDIMRLPPYLKNNLVKEAVD